MLQVTQIIHSIGNMLFKYGSKIISAAPMDGSIAGNPKTLSILVGENNYGGQSLYLDNLTFVK